MLGWRVFGIALLLLCLVPRGNAEPASMTPEFHQTVFIGKPASEVWAALTTKATVDRYYLAPLLDLELKKGGRIAYGREAAMIEGTITELDAPRKFSHTFRFTGVSPAETLVTYEIEPVGDAMCVLSLTHSGFQSKSQAFEDVTGGWPVILSSLKTLMETGKTLPWPKP